MAAVRVALAQEGRDPSGAALAVPAPAAAPAMVLADCSDHRDRSQVWESASSAQIGGTVERRPSRGIERDSAVTLDARLSVLCDCYEIIKQNYERSAHPFDDGSCSLIY